MPLVTIASSFTEALKKNGVFSDVIDEFEQTGLISAKYGKNDVTMGNTLKVSETQERPEIQLTFLEGATENSSYTLVITDPDAPKRGDPTWSEYAHYIVSGIKPAVQEGESYKLDFSKAVELLEYMGPGPPEKTGKHRYVFILYKESSTKPEKIPGDRPNWGTGKPGSGVREWASKYNLSPVAVNFYLAQNEVQE